MEIQCPYCKKSAVDATHIASEKNVKERPLVPKAGDVGICNICGTVFKMTEKYSIPLSQQELKNMPDKFIIHVAAV